MVLMESRLLQGFLECQRPLENFSRGRLRVAYAAWSSLNHFTMVWHIGHSSAGSGS